LVNTGPQRNSDILLYQKYFAVTSKTLIVMTHYNVSKLQTIFDEFKPEPAKHFTTDHDSARV